MGMTPHQEFQEKVEAYVEKAGSEAGVEVDYSTGEGGVEFEAEVSDDSTGLTAEIVYEADSDSLWSQGSSGEFGFRVYDNEVLYDRSIDAALEGSHVDDYILVKVPVRGQTPKATGKLDETVENALELAEDLVSNPSILRYEQIFENSTAVRNDASKQLRKNIRNNINQDTDFPQSPLRRFGKGFLYTRHPEMNEQEARRQLQNSEEAEKWRELGEKIRDDELGYDTFQEILKTLENNPGKKVTEFAV